MESVVALHYEELPEGMGFPNADDMRQWQLLFEKAVAGGKSRRAYWLQAGEGAGRWDLPLQGREEVI
ncbi:hypothetical protein [Mesorhizobium marinum]|uniref:hypothetical protein n=1 Tax=Mesorhizobium marinum TaxID=3228790 RepID=UPI003465C5C1